jgi:hypothetical protein
MKYPLPVSLVLAASATAGANPHPNPFSYPYVTLPENEAEVEQHTDLTPVLVERENSDGTRERVYSLRSVLQTELEIGLTDRLELGFYVQFKQAASASTPSVRFSGVSQRLHYRFAEKGELPVDIGIYGEVSEFTDEIELEQKLLLERSFGDINVVANLWFEQEWYFQVHQTKYLLNPTLAMNYEISPKLTVGAEYWARGRFDAPDANDTTGTNDAPSSTRHYLGPTLLFESGKLFFALGAYARLDAIANKAVVGDPYGKLWLRTIVGVDL